MFDVVALGELLIDFAPMGERVFQANAGGAPANVLASLVKLEGSGAFIGMVGNDDFGRMLESDIKKAGINASGLRFTDKASTTMAFVQLDEHGDRSFTFARKPGADMLLTEADVDYSLIDSGRIFHFGSVSMTAGPCSETTLAAARYAHSKGIIVSYDPNLRPPLWDNLEHARQAIIEGMQYCDILKISEEELEFITGKSDLEFGTMELHDKYGVQLILVTLGPKGCFYRCPAGCGRLPTFDVHVVDTTGAGDAFLGGVLWQISRMDITSPDAISLSEMEKIVEFANAVGALATSKKGAISIMPTMEQVQNCIKNVRKLD